MNDIKDIVLDGGNKIEVNVCNFIRCDGDCLNCILTIEDDIELDISWFNYGKIIKVNLKEM